MHVCRGHEPNDPRVTPQMLMICCNCCFLRIRELRVIPGWSLRHPRGHRFPVRAIRGRSCVTPDQVVFDPCEAWDRWPVFASRPTKLLSIRGDPCDPWLVFASRRTKLLSIRGIRVIRGCSCVTPDQAVVVL